MLEEAGIGIASYGLSAVSTIIAKGIKDKNEREKLRDERMFRLAGVREKSVQEARKVTDSFTKMTRRFLALGLSFSIVLLPMLLVAFGDVPLFVENVTKQSGFWFFTDDKTVSEFIKIDGIAILKEFRQAIIIIVCLYFGNSHARD